VILAVSKLHGSPRGLQSHLRSHSRRAKKGSRFVVSRSTTPVPSADATKRLKGPARPTAPLVRTSAIEFNPEISPNGRYMAYQSNESGREAIYVRPFPRVDEGRWEVSAAGGTRPVWARNGRELFYVDLADTLISVPVQTSGTMFVAGRPVKLFETGSGASLTSTRDFDVAPDGERFLMIKENVARNTTPPGMVVVERWFELLNARLPGRH